MTSSLVGEIEDERARNKGGGGAGPRSGGGPDREDEEAQRRVRPAVQGGRRRQGEGREVPQGVDGLDGPPGPGGREGPEGRGRTQGRGRNEAVLSAVQGGQDHGLLRPAGVEEAGPRGRHAAAGLGEAKEDGRGDDSCGLPGEERDRHRVLYEARLDRK